MPVTLPPPSGEVAWSGATSRKELTPSTVRSRSRSGCLQPFPSRGRFQGINALSRIKGIRSSVCLLPRLALWERWIGAKRQDGEGYHRLLTTLSCCLQHKLFPEGEAYSYFPLVTPSVTPASVRDTVSLRLGHGAALAAQWATIHYRAAASLPDGGGKSC